MQQILVKGNTYWYMCALHCSHITIIKYCPSQEFVAGIINNLCAQLHMHVGHIMELLAVEDI